MSEKLSILVSASGFVLYFAMLFVLSRQCRHCGHWWTKREQEWVQTKLGLLFYDSLTCINPACREVEILSNQMLSEEER